MWVAPLLQNKIAAVKALKRRFRGAHLRGIAGALVVIEPRDVRFPRLGYTYSAFRPASLITGPHFAISDWKNSAHSRGVEPIGTYAIAASLAFTSGCARLVTMMS